MNPEFQNMLVILAIVTVAIFVFVQVVKGQRTFPYEKAGPLLSVAERVFFATLVRAVAADQFVMCKVRVADLIKLKANVSQKGQSSQWWKAFAQISQKHVDFVVVDKRSFEARVVVELDDASHRSSKAKDGDDVKNKAFAAAGIPLLRVKAKRDYEVNEVALALINSLQPAAATPAKRVVPAAA